MRLPRAIGAYEGCLSSLGTGSRLVASGEASIVFDALVLSGSQMPNSSALYFQGTTAVNGGAGVAFGDGLRCAGGSTVRLQVVFASPSGESSTTMSNCSRSSRRSASMRLEPSSSEGFGGTGPAGSTERHGLDPRHSVWRQPPAHGLISTGVPSSARRSNRRMSVL
mgnify:CR=1 FL=1